MGMFSLLKNVKKKKSGVMTLVRAVVAKNTKNVVRTKSESIQCLYYFFRCQSFARADAEDHAHKLIIVMVALLDKVRVALVY